MTAAATAATAASGVAGQMRRRRQTLDYLDVERSSLHRALDEGRYQSVVYQVKLGMDPNVRSRQGLTPLMRCARIRPLSASLQLIRALLGQGANPDLTDGRGNNLLQLAVMEGNAALVKLLLTENNVNFHHRNLDGDTVLHLLAHQSPDLCRAVLRAARRFHIDCDLGNGDGVTPLMAACRAGNLPVVELLATLGKASLTKRDARYRRSPQDWLRASLGPSALALQLAQLQSSGRHQAGSEVGGAADPYEQMRQSRRLETLTRLFQGRQPSQQLTQAEVEADEAAASEDATAEATERPGTAKTATGAEEVAAEAAAAAAASVASSQLFAALRRSRTAVAEAPGNQSRLLRGIFGEYELQMSASYRRPAVTRPSAANTDGSGGGGAGYDSRSGSRVSSGRSQQRSPTTPGGGLSRRMTEFTGANLRMKQRIRSGVRPSEPAADSSAFLNTSQDSGGLRRQTSRQ